MGRVYDAQKAILWLAIIRKTAKLNSIIKVHNPNNSNNTIKL